MQRAAQGEHAGQRLLERAAVHLPRAQGGGQGARRAVGPAVAAREEQQVDAGARGGQRGARSAAARGEGRRLEVVGDRTPPKPTPSRSSRWTTRGESTAGAFDSAG